jgi:hypothetical protein
MKRAATISLLFLVVLCIGCSDQATEPNRHYPDPNHDLDPGNITTFFPLKVGYTWNYVDSLFYENSVTVRTRSVILERLARNGDSTVLQFRSWFSRDTVSSVDNMLLVGDSLYEFQYGRGGGLVFSQTYFPAPDSGTYFNSLIGGDVGIMKSAKRSRDVVVVPAGRFVRSNVFEWRGDRTFVADGVGMIRSELYGGIAVRILMRSSTLLSYGTPW